MKRKNLYVLAGLTGLLMLGSCIKQIEKKFTGESVVEIDAAPLNSVNATAGYPIIAKIPPDAIPVRTTDSTLRRLNGIVRIRLNLVGPQSESAQTVGYKVMSSSPITTFAFPATATGQTPSAAAATLTVTNAVAGTHYAALSGKVTIPAKSSFGYIEIPIINSGAAAGQARFLGIQLDSSGTLKPNPNYSRLGLVIDQR